MTTEQSVGLTLFLILWMIVQGTYIHYLRNHFTINNISFKQIGVLESKQDGEVYYIPLFKKLEEVKK